MTALKLAYQATFIRRLNPIKTKDNYENIKSKALHKKVKLQSKERKATFMVTDTFAKEENKKIKVSRQIFCGGMYIKPKRLRDPYQADSSPTSRDPSNSNTPINTNMPQGVGFGIYIHQEPETPSRKANQETKKKLKEEAEKLRYQWPRNPAIQNTTDYLTLLRKTTSAILANQGFIIREVFLNNGREIGLVLTVPDAAVKKALLEMGVSRVVELGIADILSMEPIDSRYRPLRLNRYLHQEDEWDRHYSTMGSDAVEKMAIKDLREDIVNLLDIDCDAKRIVRLCGSVWPENSFDGDDPTIYNHEVVPLETWYCYRRFLLELATQLKFIEANKRKLVAVVNLHFEALKVTPNDDNPVLENQQYEAKVDIHKFVVREVVKAFYESHMTVSSLVRNGELVMDHQPSGNQKKAKVTHGLFSIWSHLKVQNKEYYHPFCTSNSKMRAHKKFFYDTLWKEYIYVSSYETIFEKPDSVSVQAFNKVERLKAASYLVILTHKDQQSH